MSETLLEIRGLTITARSGGKTSTLVEDASLTLNRGEVLGLIGESGAGKSTLGLAAMGFARDGCRLARGSVVFDGQDLVKMPERRRRRLRGARVAYVAQSAAASFNPARTLLEQTIEAPLRHGLMTRAEAEREAIALYTRLRLPDPETIGRRYPHQVSGGQLQRAMTAMAMITRPDLIVFDEPTTALDVTTQVEVLAAIRDAVAELDTAAIYITHDLAVVAQMADRIMVMRHGKVVEEGETAALMSNPQADYTKSLWSVREFRAQTKPPSSAAPHVEARGIVATYGDAPVLHGVDLSIQPGRTLAVIGESGSGKSTLARVISGLLPAREGECRMHGEALPPSYRQRSREDLRRVQMIFQMADTALNPKIKVRDALGRALTRLMGLRGRAREERLHQLMREIDMDPAIHLDRYPGELSGGQKQRIAIARALAAEPEFLICDEVTSALDQVVAEEILRLLDRLQRERGLTMMFITHDIATVRALADDVVVMKDGHVVAAGQKDDVLDRPTDPYVRTLMESAPEMDPAWLDRLLASRAA
ncbi:ABC transporter ATP-binding protein [Albimonas pacifica]|uniref:Peptide/nickel transport system ATP-binding protein n=1 Tax=Albimonas pacifica TaxID=1114924 RepID=A0A1I3BJM4_9RHOB|nr:ABC transporter ATP-binding protein [Albimonas pacifica]SFH62306.1 peptide/nickel transport system ATP-binding protein [Albimonas pacifica]